MRTVKAMVLCGLVGTVSACHGVPDAMPPTVSLAPPPSTAAASEAPYEEADPTLPVAAQPPVGSDGPIAAEPTPDEGSGMAARAADARPACLPPLDAVAPTRTPAPLSFTHACAPGARAIVAAVGDVMTHSDLQRQAYASDDHFGGLWGAWADDLQQADVTYANLETAVAPGTIHDGVNASDPGMLFDDRVYQGYPRFNAHPALLADLAAAGFDVVSTANNHAMDRGPLGVDRTIASVIDAGMTGSGTRRAGGERDEWIAFTDAGDLRIAWIACARHLNQLDDPEGQVLRCFEDPDAISDLIRDTAARADVDAVIVTPHWGRSYQPQPDAEQEAFGRAWLDAGAAAVLGAHPHVLQPIERYVTPDGREGVIAYSLGNFVSAMRNPTYDRSAVVLLTLLVDECGRASVSRIGWIPTRMRREADGYGLFRVATDDRDFAPIADALGEAHYIDGTAAFAALDASCAAPAPIADEMAF